MKNIVMEDSCKNDDKNITLSDCLICICVLRVTLFVFVSRFVSNLIKVTHLQPSHSSLSTTSQQPTLNDWISGHFGYKRSLFPSTEAMVTSGRDGYASFHACRKLWKRTLCSQPVRMILSSSPCWFDGLPEEGGPLYYHIHEYPVPADGNCDTDHFNPFNAPADCDALPSNSLARSRHLSAAWVYYYLLEAKYTDPYLLWTSKSQSYIKRRSVVFHLQ